MNTNRIMFLLVIILLLWILLSKTGKSMINKLKGLASTPDLGELENGN